MSGAIDKKTQLRERKALILRQFTMADAVAMCAHDVPVFSNPDLDDPCPACGAPGVSFMERARVGRGRFATELSRANEFFCSHCRGHGDAVTYVMANFNIASTGFALDRIEDFLQREESR